jgi:hypothetical protein
MLLDVVNQTFEPINYSLHTHVYRQLRPDQLVQRLVLHCEPDTPPSIPRQHLTAMIGQSRERGWGEVGGEHLELFFRERTFEYTDAEGAGIAQVGVRLISEFAGSDGQPLGILGEFSYQILKLPKAHSVLRATRCRYHDKTYCCDYPDHFRGLISE